MIKLILGLIVAVTIAISLLQIVNQPVEHVSARYDMPKLGMEPGAYNDMFNGDK